MMIAAVIGTIRCSSDGAATFSPSTAESTEIAGVIMLSPKNSEAPKTPERGEHDLGPAPAGHPAAPDQRDQRHDAALAVVVGAHHEQHVGDRDDDRHRPEDQRDDPEDALGRRRHRVRIAGIEDRLDRVQRARADVAEDDTQRADGQRARAVRCRCSASDLPPCPPEAVSPPTTRDPAQPTQGPATGEPASACRGRRRPLNRAPTGLPHAAAP